jgi:hypothetical protein
VGLSLAADVDRVLVVSKVRAASGVAIGYREFCEYWAQGLRKARRNRFSGGTLHCRNPGMRSWYPAQRHPNGGFESVMCVHEGESIACSRYGIQRRLGWQSGCASRRTWRDTETG